MRHPAPVGGTRQEVPDTLACVSVLVLMLSPPSPDGSRGRLVLVRADAVADATHPGRPDVRCRCVGVCPEHGVAVLKGDAES